MLQLLRQKKRQASIASEAASEEEGAAHVGALLLEGPDLVRLLRQRPSIKNPCAPGHAEQPVSEMPASKRCRARLDEAAELIHLLHQRPQDNDSEEDSGHEQNEASFVVGWDKMHKFAQIHFWEKAESTQQLTKPKRAYNMVNRTPRDITSQRHPFKENGVSPARISSLLGSDCHCSRAEFKILLNGTTIVHLRVTVIQCCFLLGRGARRNCYRLFASRKKDLCRFLQEFWSMPKRDQDNLAARQQSDPLMRQHFKHRSCWVA